MEDNINLTENNIAQDLKNDMPPELKVAGNQRRDSEARWYVLHTFNGYEAVAEDNLKKVVEKYHLEDRVLEIYIPTEDVMTEKKDGTKSIKSQHSMPTYIFVKMIYGDDIWHAVTRTQYISSFVGPKGRPVCITDDEVARLGLGKISVNIDINVGDVIEILDGPLASFVGTVTDVDKDNLKLKATVEMFGRDSTVELSFNQVRVKN